MSARPSTWARRCVRQLGAAGGRPGSGRARLRVVDLEERVVPANWSGTLPAGTTTWSNSEVQRVTGPLTVPQGATLVIDPGTVVKVTDSAGVSLVVNGTLDARGTAGQPIVITSLRDDSAGGDTNGDGTATSPAAGQWNKILFAGTSTGSVLDHVEVRYGGNDTGAIVVDGGQLTLSNSVLRGSRNAGIRFQNNPAAALTNITFQDNAYAASMDLTSSPAIAGTTTLTNNGTNALLVDGGTISTDVTWNSPALALFLTSGINVAAGHTLTINAGQVIKFGGPFYNTLEVDGTLLANGTAAQPVVITSRHDDGAGGDTDGDGATTSPQSGDWGELKFTATSSGSVLDHVAVRYGGGASPGDVESSAASLTIRNSAIGNTAGDGMRLHGAAAVLTGNTFANNAGSPIHIDPASTVTVSGNTLTNNGVNGVGVEGGTVTADAAWANPDVVYYLLNQVTVGAGHTLTVGAGQVIKFGGPGYNSMEVDGTLLAQGTAAQPIVFTSRHDDSAGGDTDNDGTATGPAARDWGELHFAATSGASVLDHVVAKYGGSQSPAAVEVNGAAITVRNSTFEHAGGDAVHLTGSNAALSNVTIRDNPGTAVQMTGSRPVLTGVTFLDNFGDAIHMDLASGPALSDLTFTNNATNGVLVDGGTITADTTWDNPQVAYVVNGSVVVGTNATLTVGAGQVVKLKSAFNDIEVKGTLKAAGTAFRPITFTSVHDDSALGDTNNDGPNTTPAAGDWFGVFFDSGSTGSLLDHVAVRYAGGDHFVSAGAIYADHAGLTLTNSEVSASGVGGVQLIASSPVLTGDTISNNNGAAVTMDPASNPAVSGTTAAGNAVDGVVVGGGTLPGDVTWAARGLPYSLSGTVTVPQNTTLTVAAGAQFLGNGSGSFGGSGAVVNAGSFVLAAAANGSLDVAPQVVNTGTLDVRQGTLNLNGGLLVNGPSVLTGSAAARLNVRGNLGGGGKNVDRFSPPVVNFNGGGTAGAPQTLEVMGRDLGNTGAGFAHNFGYYTLSLANSTYVRLVDASDNAAGAGAEALYVNNLTVPAGSTLDLNGLHLYTRLASIQGTVRNGTVTPLPSGGALALGTPAVGTLAAGGIDDWTFFARANQAITLTVSTGATSSIPPPAPAVNFVTVSVLKGDTTLGTAGNALSGAEATLAGAITPAGGILDPNVEVQYHVHVQAPVGHSSSAGNYVITAWDATARTAALTLGETAGGTIDTPFRTDNWTFTGTAGQAVRFDLVNVSNPAVAFDLTGPNGFTAFANATAGSGPITLPSAGTYTVTARGTQGQTGSYAFQLVNSDVSDLALGVPVTRAIQGPGQSQVFRLNVTQPGQVTIALTDGTAADENELYESLGAIPTRSQFHPLSYTGSSADKQLTIPAAAPGTYFILVYNAYAAAPGSFTLTATEASVVVTGATPDRSGTGATTTLTLTGAGFDRSDAVTLVSAGGTSYPAASASFDSPTRLTATFTAGSLPAGTYSANVTETGGGTSTLPNAITLVPGGAPKFSAKVLVPSAVGYHVPATFFIEYSNTGDVAMPAPLIVFTPTQTHADGSTTAAAFLTLDAGQVTQGFWTSSLPAGFSHTVEILASGSTPGILQPGESERVPVYYAGWQQPWDGSYPPMQFNLSVVKADDPSPYDWALLKRALPLPGVPQPAWDAIFTNLQAQSGATWGSVVSTVDQNAVYLSRLGDNVNDFNTLLGFEVMQADGINNAVLGTARDIGAAAPGLPLAIDRSISANITSHHVFGPFGYGWVLGDGWGQSLQVAPDGTVTVRDGATGTRIFQPDSRGSGYFAQPGDLGVLASLGGGVFTLTEPGGRVTEFADGKIAFVQDTNGNRVTAGYTGGSLTSLTETSGAFLHLNYNPAGLIASITNSDGQTAEYAYDATNHFLISATDSQGFTTGYGYSSSSNPAIANALVSVTKPDGTRLNYSFDAAGRLLQSSAGGGLRPIQYGYPAPGAVAATDADHATTVREYDDRGRLGKVVDPLGNVSAFAYDPSGNVSQMTDAGGQVYSFTHDSVGNLVRYVDPLGNMTKFTYGPLNTLTAVTDPKGNTTRYQYDQNGNLTSTVYASGALQTAAYNPIGEILHETDANGTTATYSYYTTGQVHTATLPDGSVTTYTYDAHGNLATAADASGTVTLLYDGHDHLKEVDYPDGTLLKYTYDPAGRRIQMVDQTGFTVHYAYNSLGGLAGLTDGANSPIVTYSYDDAGLLIKTLMGDGTYTLYDYDLGGHVRSVVNDDAAGTARSRFDYVYNDLGLCTSETTIDGQWAYGYDAVGQLTQAVFTPNATDPDGVPAQNLQYAYDAAGNRISSTANGVVTTYVTNAMNQYTSSVTVGAGETTYQYDADGNLVSKAAPAGSTTNYAYDLAGRLVGITASGSATGYQYNAIGQRVASTLNGQTTQYLIDPNLGGVVAELNGTGSLVAHYISGLGLTSRVDASNASAYYNFDADGNTAALTGAGGGNRYAYAPFGSTLAQSGSVKDPFTFSGQFGVMTAGNGMYLMPFRSYDSSAGRFMQLDPVGIAGGMNLYEFALNSPVDFSDSLGLAPLQYDPNYNAEIQSLWTALMNSGKVGFAVLYQLGRAYLNNPTDLNALNLLARLKSLARLNGVSLPTAATGTGAAAGEGAVTVAAPGMATTVVSTGGAGAAAAGGASVGAGTVIGGIAVGIGVGAGIGYLLGVEHTYDQWVYDHLPTFIQKYIGPVSFARDPNDKMGPAGYGPGGFVADLGQAFPYRIDFENDPTAPAPAQRVVVTDQLDPHLDWSTFAFTQVGFGDNSVTVPAANGHFFRTTLSMTYNGQTFDVQIQLSLDLATGVVTAVFQSIDPLTSLPPDVLTGFLPPEDGTGRGQGFVDYLVTPRPDLATGTQIRNVAAIVFDVNDPITTDQVSDEDPSQGVDPAKQTLVTIDADPPVATINPVSPVSRTAAFPVTWDGYDPAGAGYGSTDVYVSVDGGPYLVWKEATSDWSATYPGQAGHRYDFVAVGRDLAGNVQAFPAAPQATVVVPNAPTPLDDAFVAVPGRKLAGNVLANDLNPAPAKKVTVVLVDPPAQGALALAATGAFTYTPPAAGWTGRDAFTYKLRYGTGQESAVARVDVAAGLAGFRATAVSVSERLATATLTVDLTGPASAPVTVGYAVAPQSARGRGEDFTLGSGTLSFATGEKTKTITFPVTNDLLDEANETLQVWLTGATGPAAVGRNRAATVTILDDDPLPKVSFRQKASAGPEDQSPSLEVVLSAPSGRPVTVKYQLAGGTAKAGADFTFAPGVLTFAPGETSKVIPIAVLNDAVDEPDETVRVLLTGPANAVAGVNMLHTYTIQSDDPLRAVGFDAAGVSAGEAAGTVLLAVRLSEPAPRFPVTVGYAVDAGGTAAAGKDFTLAAGTLTFKPGETQKAIPVRLLNDKLHEPAETVRVRLSNPVNAVLGLVDVLTLTIQDDDPA